MGDFEQGADRASEERSLEEIARAFTARVPEKFHPDKYTKRLMNPWAKALMRAALQSFNKPGGFSVANNVLRIFGIEASDEAVYNSVKSAIRSYGHDRAAALSEAIDQTAGNEGLTLINLAEEAVRALPRRFLAQKPKGGARPQKPKTGQESTADLEDVAAVEQISADIQFTDAPYWKTQPRAALIVACMLDAGANADAVAGMLGRLYPTHNIPRLVIEQALETPELRKSVSEKIKTDQKWEQKSEDERAFILDRAADQKRNTS